MAIHTGQDSSKAIDLILPMALDEALECVGEPAKRELLARLKLRHRISLQGGAGKLTLATVAEISEEILGPAGRRLVIEQIWLVMEKIAQGKYETSIRGLKVAGHSHAA
ncbi:MAG: hypothetical protein ABI361_09050 [Nitrososphaera sp.]